MIGADSIIHILDIEHDLSIEDTIANVFAKYFERGVESGPCNFFNPKPGTIKIRDLQGWTDLLQMTKQFNPPGYTMAEIRTRATIPILVNRDQLLPVYDRKSEIGFHGEIKYHFSKCAARIFYDGMIKNLRTADNQFVSSDMVRAITIYGSLYTYGVNTKSGFFNANNLYLLSDLVLYEKKRK